MLVLVQVVKEGGGGREGQPGYLLGGDAEGGEAGVGDEPPVGPC